MKPWCERHWQTVWRPAIEQDQANGILGTVLLLQRAFSTPEYEKAMRLVDALFPPSVPRSMPNPQNPDGPPHVNPQIASLAMQTMLGEHDELCEVVDWSVAQDVMREAGVPPERIPATRDA